jgi:hypothetical protein|tara:strand:- start:2463 stop:2972 length:510 start_codon:yes stop_codon:yes gene_type:complete
MTINEKLATIQTRFKSKKSRFNSFGKYYFRSAEDILEAIKPFIKELGVTVVINEELVDSAVIKTTATVTDGKETINATAVVGVDLDQKGMQMPQRFGSASSYGKKYALGNLFLIDDTQDSDATNTHDKTKITGRQLAQAKDYIKSGGKIDAIKKKYQLTSDQEKTLNTL